jgi:hypothetical protein
MEDFDLVQYIAPYVGEAYIDRLEFIASRSPALAPQALKLAIEAVKRTPNTTKYAQLVTLLNEAYPGMLYCC